MSVIIWPFAFLMRTSEKVSSLKLCFLVNFILWCKFWIKLCKLLMLPHGHFQNMKQPSMYIFHDLINSVFIVLYFYLCFDIDFPLSMLMLVAYFGAILVPIPVPRVWMLFMLSKWK